MSDILELLSEGVAQDEILEDFPDLELDDIRACLEWHKDKDRFLQ